MKFTLWYRIMAPYQLLSFLKIINNFRALNIVLRNLQYLLLVLFLQIYVYIREAFFSVHLMCSLPPGWNLTTFQDTEEFCTWCWTMKEFASFEDLCIPLGAVMCFRLISGQALTIKNAVTYNTNLHSGIQLQNLKNKLNVKMIVNHTNRICCYKTPAKLQDWLITFCSLPFGCLCTESYSFPDLTISHGC